MSIATSIYRTSAMVKECCRWLQTDLEAGGFSALGSMSEMDLAECELMLVTMAADVHRIRQGLLDNNPDRPRKLELVK